MKHREMGVTLLELVIVLMILSTLVFAFPNLRKMLNSYRLDSYSRSLLIDVQYALRMAQNNAKSVSLCISDDQINCATTGDLYNWHRGWIIFFDVNNDFIVQSNTMLRQRQFSESLIYHISDTNIMNAIRLNGRGKFGSTAGSGLPSGKMSMCIDGLNQIDLKISIFGEARLEKQNKICIV